MTTKRLTMSGLAALLLVCAMPVWAMNGSGLEELSLRVNRPDASPSFQILDEGRLVVSVVDAQREAVLGLTRNDFMITRGPKTAQVLSVEPLKEERPLGLNLVLVLDNSYSMERRQAVGPVLAAMQELLTLVRPIDDVAVVTFVDPRPGGGAPGPDLPRPSTRVFRSGDAAAISQALAERYSVGITTDGTYLKDAMLTGLEIAAAMPAKNQKFMVVFSDGEDINSTIKEAQVTAATAGLANFTAFAVDYMDRPGLDPFLQSFVQDHHGQIKKAKGVEDFLPIFKSFASTIFHKYLVTYRFLAPPAGTLAMAPAVVRIEEVTVVDSSPMLPAVYFDAGSSTIPPRYVTLASQSETAGFAEEKLTGTMEKHHQVLNVIGRRLQLYPEASVTIVGCNANTGPEKGALALSRSRADAVAAYLRYVWGIEPARLSVTAQNLPDAPSTSRVPEGVAENQRAEIRSDHPAILDVIKSTYIEEAVDAKQIRVIPAVEAEAGVASWQMQLLGGETVLDSVQGQGPPPADFTFGVETLGLARLASLGQLSARMAVTDREENRLQLATGVPLRIEVIRRQERIAQRLDYKVIEKYGLILFEFDRSELKGVNAIIVDRVVSRVAGLPQSQLAIVGHTDMIGTDAYNLALSQRRAQAVYDATIRSGVAAPGQITAGGVGEADPPYDNALPEGRALNRTVIISLEFMERQ
ncbi:MAG: OmpA family protein [Thermodesulfobacteriota bacterium]